MKKSSYLKYLNLSFQFFLIVLFFGIVGYFIDNYLFNNVSIFTLLVLNSNSTSGCSLKKLRVCSAKLVIFSKARESQS